MSNKKVVLCEIATRIDSSRSSLIVDFGEYWAESNDGAAMMTLSEAVLADNLWKISADGIAYEPNDTGTQSELWELDGTALVLK